MSTQKALVMQGDGKAAVVTDRALPTLRSRYLGVRVRAVALNPTDWKHIAYINTAGSLCGCDFAGEVETVGEGYSKQWKKGDRIAGMAHGGSKLIPEDGAFAEHIVAVADVQLKLPESMSFEEGATIGVGFLTCGQGLFQTLKLNLPNDPTTSGEPVLIYGGSTATGTLGIQYAKLAGYTPIAICSPRNFDLVKSLGAAAAFDYNDPECAENVKKFANNNLKICWDTISLPASAKICAAALASGGRYASLLPIKLDRDDLTSTSTLAYTALGNAIDFGARQIPAIPENYEFAKKFAAITEVLLTEGKLKVHPPKVMEGGLDGILEGLDLLKNDKVSGQKLVYKVE